MEGIISGLLLCFEQVFSLPGCLALVVGVFLGVIAGATPGLSPSMAVALLVPFSFGMQPAIAFILFVAVYQAANYGGSITAITINTPGTASAMITGIEGYQLQKKGQGGEALSAALCSSVFGGLLGAVLLMLFVVPAASIAIHFGPIHYFFLSLFGILTIIIFAPKNRIPTTLAVLLGMLFATVGLDNFTGQPRLTFGIDSLLDGIPLIPAMIGTFALAEVFTFIKQEDYKAVKISKIPSVLSKLKYWPLQVKSAFIGTFIGILPGAGATIASFISYTEAKRSLGKKENFGEGNVAGVVASEAANSSSVGGALIPLLALGIPGSATDAVLLGAFTLHGLVAGPVMFDKTPEIVYAMFTAVFLANILILFAGKLLNKIWVRITAINKPLLGLIIILLCVIGTYSLKNSWFDVYLCFFFGVLGLVMKRFKLPPAALILGLVLGTILEESFRRMLISSF